MSKNQLTILPEQRALLFDATCDDAIATCGAICCREWNVNLTPAEHAKGIYHDEPVCQFDQSICHKADITCQQLRWRFKKKADQSCINLQADNRCGIYETRPTVCRLFHCTAGWKLSHAVRSTGNTEIADANAFQNSVCSTVHQGDLRYIANPSLTFKTLFLDLEKHNATYIVKPFSKCRPITVLVDHIPKGMSEELLISLQAFFLTPQSISAGATAANLSIDDAKRLFTNLVSHQLLIPVIGND